MSNKKTDISQIRKYLNGELDARAMHQLEREAQDGPFLMDALEGYAGKTHDQQTQLNDLQQRLNKRINEGDKKRIALWPLISIAATVLVVISIGVFWMMAYHPLGQKNVLPVTDKVADVSRTPASPKVIAPTVKNIPPPALAKVTLKPAEPNAVAMNASPPTAVQAVPNAEITMAEPVGKSDVKQVVTDTLRHSKQLAMAYVSVLKKIPADSNHSLNEVVVVGYGTQRKKDITGSVTNISPSVINTPLQNRVAGVEVKTPTIKDRMYTQLITGRVVSSDDQQPLPGVNITVPGTKNETMTDAQGKFKIQASKADQLKFGYIGYEPQQLNIGSSDSLNIALSPNTAALSEGVVVGYGSKKIIKEAHPVSGWDNFKRYIEDGTKLSNEAGKVRVKFTVNPDNSLSDLKVVKSLSPNADEEAIRLIKDGPRWIHNANGKPETVEVKIVFKK